MKQITEFFRRWKVGQQLSAIENELREIQGWREYGDARAPRLMAMHAKLLEQDAIARGQYDAPDPGFDDGECVQEVTAKA